MEEPLDKKLRELAQLYRRIAGKLAHAETIEGLQITVATLERRTRRQGCASPSTTGRKAFASPLA